MVCMIMVLIFRRIYRNIMFLLNVKEKFGIEKLWMADLAQKCFMVWHKDIFITHYASKE